MKTIFDAVNELKGDLKDTEYGFSVNDVFIWHNTKQNSYLTLKGAPAIGRNSYKKVGLITEFNALVDAMSTNFGECRSINVSDYKIVTKTLLEPVERCFEIDSDKVAEVFKKAEALDKKVSNTYTQEMFDSGVLPSIGFKLKYQHEFIEGSDFQYLSNENQGGWEDGDNLEVISLRVDSNDCNVAIVLNTQEDVLTCASVTADFFKEITPPVSLIDGKAYQFECNGHKNVNGIYNDDGYFIDHNGNAYIDCTNIQPLTLAK